MLNIILDIVYKWSLGSQGKIYKLKNKLHNQKGRWDFHYLTIDACGITS